MNTNPYAEATFDRMNARARENRRLDALWAEHEYDSPEQVAIRRFQASVVLRRQLNSALSNAEFMLDRAHENRLHAGVLLGLAEGNRHGGPGPVVTAETRLRLAIKSVLEAETAHEAAVAALQAHDVSQTETVL